METKNLGRTEENIVETVDPQTMEGNKEILRNFIDRLDETPQKFPPSPTMPSEDR